MLTQPHTTRIRHWVFSFHFSYWVFSFFQCWYFPQSKQRYVDFFVIQILKLKNSFRLIMVTAVRTSLHDYDIHTHLFIFYTLHRRIFFILLFLFCLRSRPQSAVQVIHDPTFAIVAVERLLHTTWKWFREWYCFRSGFSVEMFVSSSYWLWFNRNFEVYALYNNTCTCNIMHTLLHACVCVCVCVTIAHTVRIPSQA